MSDAGPDTDTDADLDDGYRGPATLERDDTRVDVEVVLRGQVDTISGDYHWYGRIAADPAVTALAADLGAKGTVVLHTPQGEAPTRLADPDPWGRLRVEGRGHAPFHVLTDLPHVDDA